MQVGERHIGDGSPVFVIAELSANHGGSLARAEQIVRAAAEAGVDAVKLQTYTPDAMTMDSPQPWFTVGEGSLWSGRRLHDLYAEAQTPWTWHRPLADLAASLGIELFSAPFSPGAVDDLVDLGVRLLKVASFEVGDVALLRRCGATGLPVIVSTGMASEEDIDRAVATLRAEGCPAIALLRCNSAYPAPLDEMDLRTIPAMAERWGVTVGLSDHTLGPTAAITAVALGASIVEKHVTLSRSIPTADAAFSVEPGELAELVTAIRQAEAALGSVRYGPSAGERASLAFKRSLYFAHDLPAGHVLVAADLACLRPNMGLAPHEQDAVVGSRLVHDVSRGDPVRWEDLRR